MIIEFSGPIQFHNGKCQLILSSNTTRKLTSIIPPTLSGTSNDILYGTVSESAIRSRLINSASGGMNGRADILPSTHIDRFIGPNIYLERPRKSELRNHKEEDNDR